MVSRNLLQFRCILKALRPCKTAAGCKAAAGLGVDGRRHIALKHDMLLVIAYVDVQNCRKKRRGVRMLRILKNLVRGRQLHDLAEIHNRHAVGNVPHNGKIMGDKEIGQTHLLLQVNKQVDNLGLNGNVQRGNGLIADDELGAKR